MVTLRRLVRTPVPPEGDRGGGYRAGWRWPVGVQQHVAEGSLEVHLSILDGVAARYRTPFFSALKNYSHRPTGVFHALPISHGKSIVESHWIHDMIDFYGMEIFLAETSATCGGLDSLLEPTGPLREAQQLAAETFGSRRTYFVTNGTSTANKVVVQALVQPAPACRT
jgi:arginine decarboxylase